MTEQPLFVQLARLENQFQRRDVSKSDYVRAKWHILREIQEKRETIIPVQRDKRKKEIPDSLGTEFCYVSPGIFIYGEANEFAELGAGIYVAKYPVSVKQFVAFLEDSGWEYPQEDVDAMWRVSREWEGPVCHVSWLDAKEYCRWLRRKTNEYYSLPYELEWEYAARGVDGRPYPWGYQEITDTLACFSGQREYDGPTLIGSFSGNRSPFGCMEMAGGVWEFCLDEFDDPIEPHCLRGGSWRHAADVANCTSRIFSYPPTKRVDYGGFRVVYLPGEMLEEYQRYRSGEETAEQPKLQVLSHLPEHKPVEPPKPAAAVPTAPAPPQPKGSLKKIAKVLPTDAGAKKKPRS